MKIESRSIGQTEEIAKDFTEHSVSGGSVQGARIVGLHGDLGAGKTSFVKGAAKALGIREEITSPTFVIEKIYKLSHEKFEHLIHIDAYRLEKSHELLHLGWNEIAADPKNLIFIEWPERVADILPSDMMHIHFKFIDENVREIRIE